MKKNSPTFFALIIIPVSVVIAYLIYTFILGDPANFVNGKPQNEPVDGNFLGFIYKGGPVVIVLITFQLVLITYIIERFISIGKASGKNDNDVFVSHIKKLVREKKIDQAISESEQQKGSVGHVMRNSLVSYKEASENDGNKQQHYEAVKNDLEEIAHRERPPLRRNLPILATIASVATLIGLLGTVLGMIKAFASLARVGAPDAVGLANGISQALVTTALGISTAAVAIIFNNYFANRVENIESAIDETIFMIRQAFKTKFQRKQELSHA